MTREAKKKIVIENYFKSECDVNTSIKDAFIKGFELGLKKAPQEPRKDEVILTKEEYGELVSSEFDNGYAKGYREALEQESSYNSVNSLAESKLKNPKAKTFDILRFIADNAGLSTFEAIEKAYNMGVSEQEQALSKIRAEMFEEMLSHSGTGEEVIQAYVDGLKKGLNIIDKCKV